jgi:hypothetical protein
MHTSFFFPLAGLVSWVSLMSYYMELPPESDPGRFTQVRWDSIRFSLILTGVLARFLCYRVHMQAYLGCVALWVVTSCGCGCGCGCGRGGVFRGE